MDTKKAENLFGPEDHADSKDNDKLFMDDKEEQEKESSSVSTDEMTDFWKVLVVDDEEDIHSVTRMALKGFIYKDKGIQFLHTYSAGESEKVLKENPDIAVILLDVVMETNTAGLNLVRFIRDELHNKFSQIILRTGYPGYAPEREVIVSYEINDYKTKTELTAFKLFTLILASLRAYDSITLLEELRMGLEDKVKERTAELEQKNEQIIEMDQMKTRFFANISHEFRTPLTLILGPIEDMLSKEELTEKKRFGMEMMHRNALRLLSLINQLLDLAKLDAGSMKLELVDSDVFRFFRLIVSSFSSLAEQKKISYKISIPEQEFVTQFDPDKTEKIITNLLSNAFKFTPEGGSIECSIKKAGSSKKEKGDQLELTVKDSGPGIPPDMMEKVFDRFYQVEGRTGPESGGTGIGLSLTKELIHLHHGNIKLESGPEKGTGFIIRLPVGMAHLKKSEYTSKDASEINEESVATHLVISHPLHDSEALDDIPDDTGDKPLILIVEDSQDLRIHIRESLDEQFLVKEAGNGAIGLEKACETIPDLIITDLMMPEMNGVEMCDKLKTDERTSHIPVIMLTAKASADSRIEGLETGADDYLTKPFNMKELLVRINNLIQQRKLLRERFSRELTLEASDISITSADEKFLNRIIEVIEEHMGDYQFDVTKLSDLVNMSRMQLFRKLKALTDQTPSEFIRTIRLKRAAKLMEGKFGNVAEITYEVGFNNLSYFAKCFKEFFGVSPSEYVKKN